MEGAFIQFILATHGPQVLNLGGKSISQICSMIHHHHHHLLLHHHHHHHQVGKLDQMPTRERVLRLTFQKHRPSSGDFDANYHNYEYDLESDANDNLI